MKKLVLFLSLLLSIQAEEIIEIIKIEEKAPEVITYKVKTELKPSGLKGISQNQIDQHWSLYEGYVSQVNALNKELSELRFQNKGSTQNYSDRRRRYGFEYNGMILHELYFENLLKNKQKEVPGNLKKALEKNFGSIKNWKEDFKNCGKTRGIGWVILYKDAKTGDLINAFIDDHEIGLISTFVPILVMDVWEHAYMVDHGVKGRPDYIEAFLDNVNWPIVEKRFNG